MTLWLQSPKMIFTPYWCIALVILVSLSGLVLFCLSEMNLRKTREKPRR